MSDVLDIVKFEKAPCYRCGYSGHSYFQPGTHKCAADYHLIKSFMSACSDPLLAAERVFRLERRIAELEAARPEVVPTMPRSEEIRLACGELTAGEMRTAKAVLQWFISTRCQPQKERS